MIPKPFPKLVDDPPNILFWSADEIAPLFGAVALGMVLDAMLICVCIAFIWTRLMSRYKNAKLKGFGLHMLWYQGFIPMDSTKSFKNPYARNYYS
jgi:conjugal transfer pilus assembly protein TraL